MQFAVFIITVSVVFKCGKLLESFKTNKNVKDFKSSLVYYQCIDGVICSKNKHWRLAGLL